MKIDLKNKTALICASSYGIGFSCANILATTNANIILTSRLESNLKKAEISIKKMIQIKSNKVPSNKIGEPNDIGHLSTFLSSNYASYINGQFIAVDGGKLGIKS